MNEPDQIQIYEATDTDVVIFNDILIDPHISNDSSDSDTDSDSNTDSNTDSDAGTNPDNSNKKSRICTIESTKLISDITDIIKSHVQNLMMFNYEFPNLFQLFKKNESSQKHNIILTDDMPPIMKAKILGLLNEKEFLRIMVNDTYLMEEVMPHLDDTCFLLLILTLTNQIIVPMLLKIRTFLTIDRVRQLKKFGSDLYGLDYCHIIANNINNTSENTLSESIKCIEPNILPDDKDDAKNIIKILSEFISTSGIELLEARLGLHTERENILRSYNVKSDKITQTTFSFVIDHSVKKPIKWLVDVGETIISTSTDVLKIKKF
jgi:hypothetical protein